MASSLKSCVPRQRRRANTGVYHDLGYAVVGYAGPLRVLARAGGGLRCLVLETARGE